MDDAASSTGSVIEAGPDVTAAEGGIDSAAEGAAADTGVDAPATGSSGSSTAPPGIGACLNGTGGCTEYLPGNEAVLASAQSACTTSHGTWKPLCPAQTTKGCKFPPGSGMPPMPGGYIVWDYGATSSPYDQCVQSANLNTDVPGPAAPPAGIGCTSSLKLAGSCTVSYQNKPFVCTAYYAADITTITASCATGVFGTGACPGGAKGHCVSAYASTTKEYIN